MPLVDKVKTALVGKQETCEACGAEFGCGRMLGGLCWCAKEQLSAETLADLKGRYDRCLCPTCLRNARSDDERKGEAKQ